ncbi:formyl transferase [Winogradskyella sp.]|uniref:formyl transferase n=1 Tax=Winogradskyella sp. TaxID=1883156 RepID=UPI0026194D5C|nr:formyl transferase [Winogradskyella sp.]
MDKKIIMLTGGGPSTTFMYNGIKDSFDISTVILEEGSSIKKFIKRRIKRLGYIKVFGQLLFQTTIPKILHRISQKRIKEIMSEYNLEDNKIPDSVILNVTSVNSSDCIEFLKKEKPDLIIVNGTRIISKKVLNCTDAIFINTHAGITPKYRGVHGGYWALANNDRDNCGVSVHLVDSGIDTGGVLFQENISPIKKDNFSTYPYLQIGEGILLMKKAITKFMSDELKEVSPRVSESTLWYHPTIWYYLSKRIFKGVR